LRLRRSRFGTNLGPQPRCARDHEYDPTVRRPALLRIIEAYRLELCVPDCGQPVRRYAVVFQHLHDAGRARRGEFPVRGIDVTCDRLIIGEALNADRQASIAHRIGQRRHDRICIHSRLRLTALEEQTRFQLDGQPLLVSLHRDQILRDQIAELLLHFTGDATELLGQLRLGGGRFLLRLLGLPRRGLLFRRLCAVRDHTRVDGDNGLTDLDGIDGGLRHLEGLLHGAGQDPVFVVVNLRDRVHHHEEAEQQRHEIRVGDHPPVPVDDLFLDDALRHGSSRCRG
jgi:hypothetical protein